MDIISRRDAKAAGLNKYFTGKPCKHGHIEIRNVYNSTCLGCLRVAGNAHYRKYRERRLEDSRKVYRANRAAILKRTAEYRRANVDKYRAWQKDWTKNNPERSYGHHVKWVAKNRTKVASYSRNQRAKRLLASGAHTEQDILNRLSAQKGKCAACFSNIKKRFEVDHYIPLSLGGSNNPSNLQLLCQSCNRRKHSKDPLVFYRSMGFLL